MKFKSYTVSMQEAPGEISLAIQMAGCRHRCMGCHSTHLWDDNGHPLAEHLETQLSVYAGMITCVCFMGEGNDLEAMAGTLWHIKRATCLKTCLYTGYNKVKDVESLLPWLDYLKTGEFIRRLGGLESPATNQRFYRVRADGKELENLTHLFYMKGKHHE